MRKMYLWVAIAALAMTSCSETEVYNQERAQLGYSAGIGKQVKSGPINGTTFPTNDANYYFSVFGFYKPVSGDYNYSSPYISDEPVHWNGTYWINDNTQYWPTSGVLRFAAYAPYISINYPRYSETEGMVLSDFDGTPNKDLMYTDLTASLSSGTVPFTFKHALTQIYFTIATTTPDVSFRIKRLDVQNVVGKGTFKSLPTPSWTLTTEPNWTSIFYTPYNGTGVTVLSTDAAPASLGNPLMLIPQAINGIQIVVTYDLTYTEIVGAGNTKTGLTKTITLSGANWAPNQRIKYAINISDAGPSAITYEPTISSWTTETTTGI